MNSDKLMRNISKLGFPMFEPGEEVDVNETLAEVIKSRDTRLLEGFPVLLANATESYQFSIEQIEKNLHNKPDKERFHHLLLLSSSLYSLYHLDFPVITKFKRSLQPAEKARIKEWRNCIAHNQQIKDTPVKIDSERLKKLFSLYFEQSVDKARQKKEIHEEFSLAFALSQIFSPRQRELFMKKLEGLPLTKTEQEYYSRSVKKKVVALANSELHSLARKLLEK